MQDLSKGYQYLRNREWDTAYQFFYQATIYYRDENDTLNACLYGQARALMGNGDLESAKAILMMLVHEVPRWEVPYITLARIYEQEAKQYLEAGKEIEGNRSLKQAEQTFLAAINNTKKSPRLTRNFEHFLKEHFAPWENARTFLPTFLLSALGISPETSVPEAQAMSTQPHSYYAKLP